jgi:hypothetical protein
MRFPVAIAISCVCATPALADTTCRDEALAVLARGATSGPFRFEARTVNPQPALGVVRYGGVVVPPDKASIKPADDASRVPTEEIQIGHLKWVRWMFEDHWRVAAAPDASVSAVGVHVPDADRFASISCLGEVTEGGRAFLGYEFELQTDVSPRWRRRLSYAWKVLADPASKIPLKIVTRSETEPDRIAETVESRTYDAGLKVEPPDRGETWARIAARFRVAALQVESDCRKATLSALGAALSAGPLRIEIAAEGKITHRVDIVPPGTMHVIEAGWETILAGYRFCSRKLAADWTCSFDVPPATLLKEVGPRDDTFTVYLKDVLPNAAFVRDAQCLGDVTEEGRVYAGYEYVYSEADTGRATIRKVLVDRATGLPEKFEVRDPQGNLRWTVRWTFDRDLKIELPGTPTGGN